MNRTEERRMNASAAPMHNRWIKTAVFLAGWLFVGLVLSLEIYCQYASAIPGRRK